MAEIIWTEESVRWLHEIYDYIAEKSPVAAQNVTNGIHEKTQLLKDYPPLGSCYRSEPDGDIRILLYGHYRIAYLIKAKSSVEILGVFHNALDIDKYLL